MDREISVYRILDILLYLLDCRIEKGKKGRKVDVDS
jgi:hypothetical protein